MKTRGFEIVTAFLDKNINIPVRKTARSAGYDIEAAESVIVSPGELVKIATGLKAYMQDDEYLGIHIRSSLGINRQLMLANSQGVIDADYYNNPDNEGHIIIAMRNMGSEPVSINKGDRIAQGIFYRYLVADDDTAEGARTGGFGSTGIR
ncbi:MAG: dUTP diphosphatase [Selenomonadaceae bacterium]|nr:dUTP diphosphatase [Selenomonadaceae bacterium]